ncbi:MAG: SBBP repeat-containing protein, partial [Bacteroidia bacterium]
MKKIILLLALTVYVCTTQAQSFEWAKRAGLWSFDLGYAIGTDDAGNVYISGKYERNAVFGNTTVSCAGNHDIYVAKYGSDGSFKWVRTAGGKSGDYTHAMCVDGSGNVYITGEIEYTVNFGSGVSLTSNGGNDIFVAKYNTNGDLQWARKLGGSSKSDKGLGITLSNGYLYVTGNFQGNANFAGTTISSYGGLDIFLAKYSTAGALQWVKKAGSSGDDEGYAICSDASGNFYVTGYFTGTANFGGISLSSSGGMDIFMAKYNSSGSVIWAKRAGGGATDYGTGIAIDNSGKIYLTGGFRSTSYFGSIQMKSQGNADIFVACYNNSGTPIWVKKAGGDLSDYGRAIALDGNSNSYITGNFGHSATFGSTTINGVDSTEIFFASYDASGNFRWVLKATGEADASDPNRYIEMGLSIALDHSGNVYGSGTYRSNSTFGSTTLKTWDHTDIFVTKIRQSGTPSQDGKFMTAQSSPDTTSYPCIPGIISTGSTTFCPG